MSANNKNDRSSELAMQKAANESLRLEVSKLKQECDKAANNVRELHREKQILLKNAREQERTKAESVFCDLKNRLQQEKVSELTNQKDILKRNFSAELQTILHQKEEEHRKIVNEMKRERDKLYSQLREFHKSLKSVPRENSDTDKSPLFQEVQELRSIKKKLEDSYNSLVEADRMKASEIRRILDGHQAELAKLKKCSKQEAQRLMEEIKSKDRALSQLEKELCNARNVSEPEDLKTLTSSSRSSSQSLSSSRSVLRGSKSELMEMKPEELRDQIQQVAENNKQLAQEKSDLIKKLKSIQKQIRPLLDKNKKFLERNMELTATNKLLEEHGKKIIEENCQLKEELKQWKEYKDQSGSTNAMMDQLEQQISNLKQTLKEKDQKIDHLQNACKNQKLCRLKRKFGSGGVFASDEESDASASSISIDTIPEEWDEFTWGEFEENFRRLNKEHLELEKSYSLLQKQIGGHVDPLREIKETSWIEEKHRLNGVNRELQRKIKSLEEKEIKLQQELQEIQDQNELLEFRLLELEECHEKNSQGSNEVQHQSVSTDDGVFSNSDEEEIKMFQDLKYCDLKEKITRLQNKEVITRDEKAVLIQARAVFDILDKRLTNLQISESALKDHVIRLEKEKVELLSAATGVSAEIVVDYENNRQKLLEASTKISSLEAELSELKKKEATLKYVQDYSDKELAKSKRTITNLKRQIHNAMEGRDFENQMLQETLKKMKDSETQMFELELSVKTMKDKVCQLEMENNNLHDQLSAYQDEPSVTESERDSLSPPDAKTSILELKTKLESFKLQEEDWKSKLKKEEEEKCQMKEKIDVLEKSEKEWMEKSQNLNTELIRVKEEIKRLQQTKETVTISNFSDKFIKDQDSKALQKLQLLRELGESDQYLLSMEMTDLTCLLEQKLEKSLLSENDLKEKILSLEASEILLKNHIESVVKREKSLMDKVSSLENVEKELIEQVNSRAKLLQEKLEIITNLEQTKEEMNKEYLELQEMHQHCSQQLNKMEDKVKESSEEVEKTRCEFKILTEKLKTLEENEENHIVEQQKCEIEKLKEKISNLEKILECKGNQIHELEEKNDNLEEQILEWVEMENDLKLSEQKLEAKVKAMEEIEGVLRLHLSEMEESASKAVEKIRQMEETEMDLTSRIYDLEALAQKYEERNNELEAAQHSKVAESVSENVHTTIVLNANLDEHNKLLEKIGLLEETEVKLKKKISCLEKSENEKQSITELNEKIKELQHSEGSLLERLAEQERIENRLQNRIVNAEHERIEMRDQLDKMRQKINSLEESEVSFQKKIRQLQGKNFLLERKVKQASDENYLNKSSDKLYDLNNAETQTEENYQQQLSSESAEEIFETSHVEEELQGVVDNKANLLQKINVLEKENHSLQKQLNESSREALHYEAQNKVLDTAKKEFNLKVNELEKVKSEQEMKIADLETSLTSLRHEVTIATSAIENDMQEADKTVSSNDNHKEFAQRMEELVKSESLLKQSIFELQKKEEAYRETLEEADSIMKEMERGYKMQIEQLEQSESSLKTRINQLEQAETRLKQALRHDRRIKDVRKVGELLERLLEVEASEKQLKETILEMQHSEKALQRKLKEYENIQNTFELELKDQDEVVKHLHAMEANEKLLKNKIEELENETCALQETLAQADTILEEREKSFKERILTLENVERDITQKLESANNNNFKQKDVINFLNCRIKDLQIEMKSYKDKEIILKKEKEQINQEKNDLMKEGDSLKKQVLNLQKSETQFYQEILLLRKHQDSMQTELKDLQNVNREMKQRMEQFQLIKCKLEEEINKLNNKNRELRNQLKTIGKMTGSDALPQISSSVESLASSSGYSPSANTVIASNNLPNIKQSSHTEDVSAEASNETSCGNPDINENVNASLPTTNINAENVPIEKSEVEDNLNEEKTPTQRDKSLILYPQDQTSLDLIHSETDMSFSQSSLNSVMVLGLPSDNSPPPLPQVPPPTKTPENNIFSQHVNNSGWNTDNSSRDEQILIPFAMELLSTQKLSTDKKSALNGSPNKVSKSKQFRKNKCDVKEELEKLHNEIRLKNEKISSLQDDLDKLSKILQMKTSPSEIALVQNLKDELEGLQIQLAKKEKELQTMDTEGAYYQSLLQKKSQELIQKEKELQQANQEVSKWRENYWTEEHLRKHAEKTCLSLEDQLRKLKGIESKYNDLNLAYLSLKQDHEKLTKKYQEMINQDTKLHQLEQTVSPQQHQHEELQTKISMLETELRKKYEEVEQLKTNAELSVAPLRAKLTRVILQCHDKDHIIHKLIDEVKMLRNGESSAILDEAEELQSKTDTAEYARTDSPFGFSGPESEISEDAFSQQWRAIHYQDRPFSPMDSLSSSMSSDTTENLIDDNNRRSSRWGHKSRIPRLAPSTKSSSLSSLSITRFITGRYSSKEKKKVKNSKESFPEKLSLYQAVCDYKPSRYVLDGLPELPIKKGNIVAVVGQHENGRFFRAQVNGKLGLVPISHLLPVQNPESFSTFKKKSKKIENGAPEKILNLHEELLQLRETGHNISRSNRVSPSLETSLSKQSSYSLWQQARTNDDSGLSSYKTSKGCNSTKDKLKLGISPISSSKFVTPEPPLNFGIDRVVGNSSLLISWSPPSMDEFARSNGVPVSGYRVCVDSQLKMTISSPHRSKALLENMKLNSPVHISIETFGENGKNSLPVNIVYDNKIIKSETSHSDSDDTHSSVSEKPWHLIPNKKFLAKCDYTNRVHSPQREPLGHVLSIQKGDFVTTFGPVRPDGLYYGEVQGHRGLIPQSILEEIKRTSNEHKILGQTKTHFKENKSTNSSHSEKEEVEALQSSKATNSYTGELSSHLPSESVFTPAESSV